MQMTQEDRKILRNAADISQRKKTLRQIADENKAKMKAGSLGNSRSPRRLPTSRAPRSLSE